MNTNSHAPTVRFSEPKHVEFRPNWLAELPGQVLTALAPLLARAREVFQFSSSVLDQGLIVASATNGSHLRSDYDLEVQRRNIRRAMRLGMWIWPSFTALDAYMCLVLYSGAPFLLFIGLRAVVTMFMICVYRAAARPHVPMRWLGNLQHLAFFVAALVITLMAVHLGGLRSPYMHGISIVCLVHAATVPTEWRGSLPLFVSIALVFPAIMLVTAVVSPAERGDWFYAGTLAEFAGNYVFVLASSVVAMASGHAVWAAQQQVYRARRLGRYRLQAQLGSGGMGEVWLAWDSSLRRNVALKLLRSEGAVSAEAVRRFEREARAASQVKGPHTVHVYDFGASDDGIYYIAMEHLSGLDLFSLVSREGSLPPARAVSFALQACASLTEAHAAGIIHRDIKPQNFFVTRDREGLECIKLLDFGIARFQVPEPDGVVTQPGLLAGTPAYMAPELWRGDVANVRSEIYALGATIYFMLTGSAPFQGEATTHLRAAHTDQDPPWPLARHGARLPESLQTIVLRCLAKLPQARYQSVRELSDALARLDLECLKEVQ